MAKNKKKNFIKKTDLRKIKGNITKEEKLFPSDGGVNEEELAGGVVVSADYYPDGSLSFFVVKTHCDTSVSLGERVTISKDTLSTNGVCCWGKCGFKVFDPKQDDVTMLIGESVKYMGEGSITLNCNSLATRVELLCKTASCMSDIDKKSVLHDNIKIMVKKYVFKVIGAKDLSNRDREFLLAKVEELFSCELKYFANNFKDLKRIMQQKCNEHAKNNRVYTQKKSYINIYE